MRKRVLLIDDSMTIHKIVELLLDSDNFELFRAYDSDEGLKSARENDPHIVLVDNKLCGDQDFIPNLASNPSNVGIIMLYGVYEKFPETEVGNLDVQDYLIKPFSANELNTVLASVSEGGEVNAPPLEETQPVSETEGAESETEEVIQEIIETTESVEEPPVDQVATDDGNSDTIDDPLSVIEQDIEFEILESFIKEKDDLPFASDGFSRESDGAAVNSNEVVDAEYSQESDGELEPAVKPISSKPADMSKLPAVNDTEDISEPIPMPPRAKDAPLIADGEPIAMGQNAAELPLDEDQIVSDTNDDINIDIGEPLLDDMPPPPPPVVDEPLLTEGFDTRGSEPLLDDMLPPPVVDESLLTEGFDTRGSEPLLDDMLPPPVVDEPLLAEEFDAREGGAVPYPESAEDDMVDALYNLLSEDDGELPADNADTPMINALRNEITERQELMNVFDGLEEELHDTTAVETVSDTSGGEVSPSGFRRIADLVGIKGSADAVEKEVNKQEFVRAGRLIIDLSKEELADLLAGSINTEEVQNMVKEAVRYSFEQTLEKIVRERIDQIKED